MMWIFAANPAANAAKRGTGGGVRSDGSACKCPAIAGEREEMERTGTKRCWLQISLQMQPAIPIAPLLAPCPRAVRITA
jgi:hypothetical protein